MVVKIKDFGLEQQAKILQRYNKYHDKKYNNWQLPNHEMKNLMVECWDLSKVLNKHKKLNQEEILNNVISKTLIEVKEKINTLSQQDFYKYVVEKLRKLKE